MSKVKPLTRRTMTLEDLQERVLKVLKQTRAQFNRPAWNGKETDREFIDRVLVALDHDIRTDRIVLKRKGYRHPCPLCGAKPE